jgi:hypothetical protein
LRTAEKDGHCGYADMQLRSNISLKSCGLVIADCCKKWLYDVVEQHFLKKVWKSSLQVIMADLKKKNMPTSALYHDWIIFYSQVTK